MSLFSRRKEGTGAAAPAIGRDFLGNVALPSSEAEERADENPRYRNGFLPIGLSIRLIFALGCLVLALTVLVIVLLVRENAKVQVGPQVFMQNELGKLIPVATIDADLTVPYLEAFLDHVVSNITAVRDGELSKSHLVKHLMDERAYNEIVVPLIQNAARLRTDRVSINQSVNRIDTSAPERFVMNRKYKRTYGIGYGQAITVTGNGGGRSRDTRWDFEIVMIPRTAQNSWGLFVVQLKERALNWPLPTIPPELRKPEDLIAVSR